MRRGLFEFVAIAVLLSCAPLAKAQAQLNRGVMFSYAAWITLNLVLPTDLYPNHSIATLTGMSGTASGAGTAIARYLIGFVSDRYSFSPSLGSSRHSSTHRHSALLLVRNDKMDCGEWRRPEVLRRSRRLRLHHSFSEKRIYL